MVCAEMIPLWSYPIFLIVGLLLGGYAFFSK
jgi:hypothetical protein